MNIKTDKIEIDENLRLELIHEHHAQSIFDMVDRNRMHLREWLPFVDKMETVAFAENFVKGTMQRNRAGIEYAFVIVDHGVVVGRIGVYKIDPLNRVGEIGYWIVEGAQEKGIVTRSCQAMIDFCFDELELNRLEIRCGTANFKSKRIPERLNFAREGVLRQAEFVQGRYIDLDLYSLLRSTDVPQPKQT